MKILLVEDDKTIASGLEYSLQNEGYETFVVITLSRRGKCSLTN